MTLGVFMGNGDKKGIVDRVVKKVVAYDYPSVSTPLSSNKEKVTNKVMSSIKNYMDRNRLVFFNDHDKKQFETMIGRDIEEAIQRHTDRVETDLLVRRAVTYLGGMVRTNRMADKLTAENLLPGGRADDLTVEDIAKMHDVPLIDIMNQVRKGLKVEMEHTNDKAVAMEIILDHLVEHPKYYDVLLSVGL